MTPDPALDAEAPSETAAADKSAEWIKYRERGSPFTLKVMVFLSLTLGRAASRVVLYGIALYFFLFAPSAGSHSRRYLERALGRKARAIDRFRHVFYFATCIHDRVYLVKEQYRRFDITIEGEALMRGLLASGEGTFMMGAHMGSFEVMRGVARREAGLPVAMAMYEHNARKINAIFAAIDCEVKPDIIPLGQLDAMLAIADRLKGGGFVGMLGDRTLGDEPVQAVTLLGQRAYLPTGPMRAAALMRRPVIFMAGLYRGGNRYHVVFAPIADFSKTLPGERAAAIKAAIERYAALLDGYCRSDPYNWFNFFDFWRDKTPGA
jgi:predicted LPLAT superfamily acyltransferase